MFSNPLHLTVRRPSSSTVRFTISNAPVRSTVSTYAHAAWSLVLRLATCVVGAAIVFAKVHIWTAQGGNILAKGAFAESRLGRFAFLAASRIGWRVLVLIVTAMLWFIVRKGYREESLLVIRGLGIQTSSSSATYLSTATTRFIPTSIIQDIVIHEAFKGFEVRFYLAVVVDGETEVVVVFPHLLPKRKMLEYVWRLSRSCLYEPKG